MRKRINITSEFITLGQFLKKADIIASGGGQKSFLQSPNNKVFVNGEEEKRRGKKLRDGDVVEVNSLQYQICKLEE